MSAGITFAEHIPTGKIIHIDKVLNGDACNCIFASKYQLYLPSTEQLSKEIENEIIKHGLKGDAPS